MPRLNHANLPVADVAALRDFFVRWFGFVQQQSRGGDAFVVLTGEDGFVLNLMKASDGERFPEHFHVGFLLDTAAEVRVLHGAMREAGASVGEVQSLRRGGPDSVTLYCHAPNGVLVEVSSR